MTSGKITRDSKVRVVRDGIVITEDEIASLKRFKDCLLYTSHIRLLRSIMSAQIAVQNIL